MNNEDKRMELAIQSLGIIEMARQEKNKALSLMRHAYRMSIGLEEAAELKKQFDVNWDNEKEAKKYWEKKHTIELDAADAQFILAILFQFMKDYSEKFKEIHGEDFLSNI